MTDAGWRTSGYDISRLQAHALTKVGNNLTNWKDHCAGIAILMALIINF